MMQEVTILYGVDGVVKKKKIKATKITAQMDIDGTNVNASADGTDEDGPIIWVLFKDAYILELRPVKD